MLYQSFEAGGWTVWLQSQRHRYIHTAILSNLGNNLTIFFAVIEKRNSNVNCKDKRVKCRYDSYVPVLMCGIEARRKPFDKKPSMLHLRYPVREIAGLALVLCSISFLVS